ncbi:glycosyltransferase involved in cell wall biosynthesis [Xanthomonas sacchari]|uniref:glycosyltransferase family 4 protein n=1 Tax=Xanthomonas sacchari TaxID=56458 RepID=UPI002783279A|nr:glycosyltransferase family 4 protein [Xanthomonas sacchari]MDQ1094843.1 glycosyltransferase involved in cell wall biosynthesis [Xanthomonas sacchari]
MRILHVYKDFAPHRGGGGVARHIHGLAVLAAQAGHAVRVAAPAAQDPGRSDYAAVAVAASGLWPHVGWADVVHVHGARTPIAALAALLARCRGKRVVYTPHCYYDDARGLGKRLRKRVWDALVERPLLRGAARVVLLSAYWRDYLQARRMPATRALLLPNAVLAAELAPAPATAAALDGAPALLSVGRLDAVKRLHDAIALLALPGMEQAVLHLVGRGPDRARLEAFAQTHGVAARVRFHGFVGDAEVAAMAAGADAFVLPSAVEGMPTVLIEMLLLGCPVVASDIPGNRAVLQPLGLHAALYPLGDTTALAARVAALRQQRVAPQVVASVQAGFTWEGIRPQVLALYDALIVQEPAP